MSNIWPYSLSQARCHNCGFLAVWKVPEQEFLEASEHYRKNGGLEIFGADKGICPPKCFIRKADLQLEISKEFGDLFNYGEAVKKCIESDRNCTSFTPWLQGFHPKEHKEMLLNEAMLESQRAHERNSLRVAQNSFMVAILAAAISVISVGIGAYVTYQSAGIEATATTRAAVMQVEEQREIAKQEASKPVPSINVVVQMPEATASKKPGKK